MNNLPRCNMTVVLDFRPSNSLSRLHWDQTSVREALSIFSETYESADLWGVSQSARRRLLNSLPWFPLGKWRKNNCPNLSGFANLNISDVTPVWAGIRESNKFNPLTNRGVTIHLNIESNLANFCSVFCFLSSLERVIARFLVQDVVELLINP